MRYKLNRFLGVFGVFCALSFLNCDNVWDIDEIKRKDNAEEESVTNKILASINDFDKEAEQTRLKLEDWAEESRALLGMKAEEVSSSEATIDETAGYVAQAGKTASRTLSTVGTGLHYAGYIVPALGFFGEILTHHNAILRGSADVVQSLRPSNIRENVNTTTGFFRSIKQKTFGLSASERRTAAKMLQNFNNAIIQAKLISKELVRDQKKNIALCTPKMNEIAIETYSEKQTKKYNKSMALLLELSSLITNSGEGLAHLLKPYKDNKDERFIKEALDQWGLSKKFSKELAGILEKSEEVENVEDTEIL